MLIKSLKCSFLLVFCLQFPPSNTSRDNLEKRAHLVRQSNDNLLLEPAWDRNVSLRLMGESATVTINDVDMMTVLRRRQRIIADRQAARREPLKVDAVRDMFHDVELKMTRIQRRIFSARNSTKRSGLNQRILRRQLQRVERVKGILQTLAGNLARNECLSNPCKNGGTCHDAYKGFQCECPAGWQVSKRGRLSRDYGAYFHTKE